MTKSMTYCSLEEAWGDNYVQNSSDNPPKIKPDNGNQYSTDLEPQSNDHSKLYDDTIPNNSDMRTSNEMDNHNEMTTTNRYLSDKDKYAMVKYADMNKEKLWDEFIEFMYMKNKMKVKMGLKTNSFYENLEEYFEHYKPKEMKNKHLKNTQKKYASFAICMSLLMAGLYLRKI